MRPASIRAPANSRTCSDRHQIQPSRVDGFLTCVKTLGDAALLQKSVYCATFGTESGLLEQTAFLEQSRTGLNAQILEKLSPSILPVHRPLNLFG